MFSGIIETTGTILKIMIDQGCKQYRIAPFIHFDDLSIGDSISVNGVCLTITEFSAHDFQVTAVPETLRLTNLDQLQIHHHVNLERSLKPTSRIGGHYVQGHIDGVGQILEIFPDNNSSAWLVKISYPSHLAKYIIPKGYIGLDGMSITVIDVTAKWFTVTFIPHTQTVTIVKNYQIGNLINIEVDMISKYVEKILGAHAYVRN